MSSLLKRQNQKLTWDGLFNVSFLFGIIDVATYFKMPNKITFITYIIAILLMILSYLVNKAERK